MEPTTTPDAAPADPALERLRDQVRAARAANEGLELRGGGTKHFYGGAARGTPLDLRELRGICQYDPTEMVITARAGTPLAEVEAALAERGQCLAFEPPRFAPGGTLGGMVAAGLAGPARASAGSVRDFVLGAVLMNGEGETLRFGGQVMKNVAGFDISRVLAGSLGTLGLICEVSIKVPPMPLARTTLRLELPAAQALTCLHRWTGTALPVHASAWHGGILHVRLAGAAAAVDACERKLVAEHSAQRVEPAQADDLWNALRDQSAEFFTAGPDAAPLWRLSVPATCPPLEMPEDTLIEWGGAQRWLFSARPAAEIRRAAAAAGGHATRFRGGNPADEVFSPLPPALQRLNQALKRSFDPAGIFNPGRLYPWM